MRRRIHLVRQLDSMQCGAACIATICSYHGREMTLAEAEEYCHCGKRGVSLLGVSEAAQDLGFHPRAARFTIRQLSGIPLPCILYWNQNHFVILYKIHRKKFYIADPGKGKITYSMEEFRSGWVSSMKDGFERGIALVLEPTVNFSGKEREKKNGKPPESCCTIY